MNTPEILGLVPGSAAVGAFISSIVNGIFNRKMKRQELERQDMEMALKMAELKHQQVVTVYNWHAAQGGDPEVTFIDPLMSVTDYHKGIKEYRQTRQWKKGQAGRSQAATEMVGHQTESVYRRYAINDERMLREGGAKLAALHQAEREQRPTVLPIIKPSAK